ncbi:hypothetical protein DSL72_002113 [Monilinia vaccinii-corymbosi]|uniref:Uncharacterized protein n=1 Tax=Monilinia vaccinii-corymbosi TaxID=61207 RepID=A0A8A3PBP1_9HELO|nr:hypothetical protein DSL72_002113 [Monilinia vaccinii-corymbosi]
MNYLTITITATAGVSLLYFLGYCIYNLYFHPLKSFTGPKLWVACRVPMTYYKLKGDLPYKLKELHDKYGDVVRIAPNYLDYSSSAAWEDIYGFPKDHHKQNFPKDMSEVGMLAQGTQNIISASDEDHRRFRRLQSHAFSEKALAAQEELIQDYARTFISGLIKFSSLASDHSINLGQWYNCATFDLLGDLAFGEPFGSMETGDLHPWTKLLFSIFEADTYLTEALKYPIIGNIACFLFPALMQAKIQKHWKLSQEKAYRRIDTPRDKPDFVSYILKYNDTEKGMSREEIGANASILILAGSETTASILNGVTYHLLQCPTILQNLTLELRSTFKNQEELTLLALARCKYLNAVLDEGLRIFPPVPSTLTRFVPEGGSIISGQYVPEGATVGVNQWSANFSSSNFHVPYEFHPERWLSTEDVQGLKERYPDMQLGDPSLFKNDDRKARQPFSVGPRNCIGKNLAYAEMRVLLANVVWGFNLEGGKGSRSWLERNKVFGLWMKPELCVRLERVNV